MTSHRNRWLTVALVGLTTVLLLRCDGSPLGSGHRSAYQREQVAESLMVAQDPDTIYQRRMRDLRRRAMLVRTDSLARLDAALFTVPDSMRGAVRQAIGCENYRLIAIYGDAAADRALARLRDSLERAGMDPRRREVLMETATGPSLELSSARCGPSMGDYPVLPDSVENELSFSFRLPPPRPTHPPLR